jgi:metallo-beta-lactamase family protein
MKNYHEKRGVGSNAAIESFGASGGLVTGSCHRLTIKNSSVSIDYGMFQGRKEERNEKGVRNNFAPVESMAHGVTDVLLTHLHIDHSGNLPKIYKAGFRPRILTTEITAHFLETMLVNSAEIQSREDKDNRIYEMNDVRNTLRCLKTVNPFTEIQVGQKHSRITAEFLPNGHVMGAASILVRSREDGKKQNILFTGDMGKAEQSLCGGYKEHTMYYPDDSINTLVIESTNFLRKPISFDEKVANLFNEIRDVWKKGGNPILPVLSFHRFPEILEILHNNGKELDPGGYFQIIIDAPLGMKLLRDIRRLSPDQLSRRYGNDANFYKTDKESISRFDSMNARIIESHEDSVRADSEFADYRGKVIILASGGMGEAGRSLNYIRGSFCDNPKNEVIFTCFQVDGTRGEKMVHEETIPNGNKKGASVKKIEGFTSHISGPEETFNFLKRFNLNNLHTIIINHGKNDARVAMANEFRLRQEVNGEYKEAKVVLPKLNQKVELL